MSEAVENLIVDFVEWVGRRERTYSEALETWRTSCPKLPIWEDANDRGLVETAFVDGRLLVRVTQAGLAMLRERRPQSLQHLR